MSARSEEAKERRKKYHALYMRKYRKIVRKKPWDKEAEAIAEAMVADGFKSTLNKRSRAAFA